MRRAKLLIKRDNHFHNGGSGAGEGIRTLDINLGKVALYQLSYARLKMVHKK